MLTVKDLGKTFSYQFFNNTLHLKMDENESISKICHSCDLQNLLQLLNTDEPINHLNLRQC